MLVDHAQILVKAGKGGDGAISFLRNARTSKGGPDGGNGGNGGDVYIQGVNDIEALGQFQYKKVLRAEDGIPGAHKNLYGRSGKDLIIHIPIGTTVIEQSGKEFEITDESKILIAHGGKGGRGNNEFKSSTIQAPRYRERGVPGEEKHLMLELRLIADVGLIGLPNAGKSSLLHALTNAHPKIGNYPFTTLEPNLGVLNGITIADIPGLIEGASKGKGLGVKFLKHIEKTKLLAHCIDATEEDVLRVYKIVRNELQAFNQSLTKKPEIILLTKSDLIDNGLSAKIKSLKKMSTRILPVSIFHPETLKKLKDHLLI